MCHQYFPTLPRFVVGGGNSLKRNYLFLIFPLLEWHKLFSVTIATVSSDDARNHSVVAASWNIRDQIVTLHQKYFNRAIFQDVVKMVINLIDVLGTRPHFLSCCQLQCTWVLLERFVVEFWHCWKCMKTISLDFTQKLHHWDHIPQQLV